MILLLLIKQVSNLYLFNLSLLIIIKGVSRYGLRYVLVVLPVLKKG